MKLVAFSVKNFRSIITTPKIPLSNLTVLVGPNNEGKSNLLSALVCALALAQERNFRVRRTLLGRAMSAYDYDRDFPISLREKGSNASTRFGLDFELDEADSAAFRTALGSKLTSILPIEISVGRTGETDFQVRKQGPTTRSLAPRRLEIADFIADRLQFQYIGAVRDEAQSKSIVEDMVFRALQELESNPEYQNALRVLEDIERPVLQTVSRVVQESLAPFISGLRSVETSLGREQRTRAMRRSTEILLDDGTKTPLGHKGDGVKSLVAIALAKALAEGSAGSRNLILAIEEPEAHLHSGAVHSLRSLLEEISTTRQVIISTHEPVLVRRDVVGANVLVQGSKARPASSLEEVRQTLGVQLTENLSTPDLVILVEGATDQLVLSAYMEATDSVLRGALVAGELQIVPLGGAGNLPHQLRFHRAMVSTAFAFVDHDLEGKNALNRAREASLLDLDAEFTARHIGLQESELEDLVDERLYETDLQTMLGLASLKPRGASAQKQKWSARLASLLASAGKPDVVIDQLVKQAKVELAERAVAAGAACFRPELKGPIDALFDQVRQRVLQRRAWKPPSS